MRVNEKKTINAWKEWVVNISKYLPPVSVSTSPSPSARDLRKPFNAIIISK